MNEIMGKNRLASNEKVYPAGHSNVSQLCLLFDSKLSAECEKLFCEVPCLFNGRGGIGGGFGFSFLIVFDNRASGILSSIGCETDSRVTPLNGRVLFDGSARFVVCGMLSVVSKMLFLIP